MPSDEIAFVLSTGTIAWAADNLAKTGAFTGDPTAYGALFQWGSNVTYYYSGGTTPSSSYTNTNTTWPSAQNPCPTGWRLPTNVEWANMLNLTDATISGQHGVTSGAYTTVSYNSSDATLRITPKSGDTTKTLILPAAGCRYDSSSFDQGDVGGYWMSEQRSSTVGWFISFNTSYNRGLLDSSSKYYALPVRCVRTLAPPAPPVYYSLSAATNTGTIITPSPAGPQPAGTDITLTAPDAPVGYAFVGWTFSSTPTFVYGDPSYETITIDMPSDNTWSAVASYIIPNPVGQVLVGSLYWARTDAIGGGKFASSETAYNNVLFTWSEAMNGYSSGTNVQGICPTGWRLPTNTEYAALFAASSNISTAGTYGDLTDGGYYTSNPGWAAPTSGTINGMTVTFFNGQSLFFPASGVLTTLHQSQGIVGGYWSSVVNPESMAYISFLQSGKVYPAFYFDSTVLAFSVRCVCPQ